jgi:hypothetical protein
MYFNLLGFRYSELKSSKHKFISHQQEVKYKEKDCIICIFYASD